MLVVLDLVIIVDLEDRVLTISDEKDLPVGRVFSSRRRRRRHAHGARLSRARPIYLLDIYGPSDTMVGRRRA